MYSSVRKIEWCLRVVIKVRIENAAFGCVRNSKDRGKSPSEMLDIFQRKRRAHPIVDAAAKTPRCGTFGASE